MNATLADLQPNPPGQQDHDLNYLKTLYVPITFSTITIIGCVGNLLVVIVILADRQMQNTTNLLIVSLALADLLFLTFVIPFTIDMWRYVNWSLGQFVCRCFQYIQYVSSLITVYTLMLMCLDRFLAVMFPIRSKSLRTLRNTIIAVVAIWVIALLVCLEVFLNSAVIPVRTGNATIINHCIYKRGWYIHRVLDDTWPPHNTSIVGVNSSTIVGRQGFAVIGSKHFDAKASSLINETSHEKKQKFPYFELTEQKDFLRVFLSLFFAAAYLIPLIFISVLYGIVIKRLLYSRSAVNLMKSSSSSASNSQAIRAKRRVTRMLIVVVAVFAISWLPIHIIFLLDVFDVIIEANNTARLIAQFIASAMSYSNSAINPIIYAFLSSNFRSAFAKLLTCNAGFGRVCSKICGRPNVDAAGYQTETRGNKDRFNTSYHMLEFTTMSPNAAQQIMNKSFDEDGVVATKLITSS